jgi:hypothetical protein
VKAISRITLKLPSAVFEVFVAGRRELLLIPAVSQAATDERLSRFRNIVITVFQFSQAESNDD